VDLRGALLGNVWMPGADLRGADLRGCVFGGDKSWSSFKEARMSGSLLEGAHGYLAGPIDLGTDGPRLLDGDQLRRWLAEQGAPQVEVCDGP
jgi:uncharacterized protein YjbI with pentapeptide repeats